MAYCCHSCKGSKQRQNILTCARPETGARLMEVETTYGS